MTGLEIVVPAYFYPSSSGSDWDRLDTAAAAVPITAIMNPFNGPGNSFNSDYGSATNSFTSAGGNLIGYVYSQYGARPLNVVLADIDRYAQWYPVDGIFVDEFSNSSDPAVLDYYNAIYQYVKSIDPAWEVMGNPGTTTVENYLTRPAADRLMIWENFGATYPTQSPPSWTANYDASRFVHLLHTLGSSSTATDYVDLAVARNVGGVYFTDDELPNPWDRLPTYWDAFVAKVESVNNQVFGSLEQLSNPVAEGAIMIDSSRSDWSGLSAYSPDVDDTTSSSLDIVEVTLANDPDELFVRLTLDGSTTPLGNGHRLLIDVDGQRGTGYLGGSEQFALGADYLILSDRLFAFQGLTQDVFSWSFLADLSTDDSTPSDIEWAILLSDLGSPDVLNFFVETTSSAGNDYLPSRAVDGLAGGFYRYKIGTPPVAGDYDGDGDVDTDDYEVWKANFGGPNLAADGNDDGVIDAADYTVWRDAAMLAGGATIPEPSLGSLLVAILTAITVAPHRRQE
ncbi:spherulation-specific family 4 protein [Botrimarina hoheduenensis]|uniref:spherulation-specific family 4 protein n=1 Tax=Botrimarina hoheduenensis TaxID=2528000 RepID=UPI0018D2B953|nr:spherulation-specific family 4 protein [Botrimarina hoheduenensis]